MTPTLGSDILDVSWLDQILGLASALAYMHSVGLVHGDIHHVHLSFSL